MFFITRSRSPVREVTLVTDSPSAARENARRTVAAKDNISITVNKRIRDQIEKSVNQASLNNKFFKENKR